MKDLVSLMLLFLIWVPDVSGQENKWESLKIPEGGFVSSIVIDPENPNTVYAGTMGVGAFKTTNGGEKWRAMAHVNSLDFVYMTRQLAIDPTNPKTIYFLPQAGLYKSEDRGATWNHNREAGGNNICIAISPNNPKVIYLGTANAGVSRSEDRGETWKKKLTTGLPKKPSKPLERQIPLPVFALSVHPESPAHVYLGSNGGGIYQSTNAGESWRKTSTGLTNKVIHDIKIDPTNPSVLYAATEGGVFKSLDGGQNWHATNEGLTDLTVGCLAIAPTHPNVLYAGVYGDGVFQSEDGGLTWQRRSHGLTGQSTFALAVSPTDSQIVYAGMAFGEDGVFKSTNGGRSWQPINNGFNARNIGKLAVSPTDSDVVYAATSSGIIKTVNGGQTWQFTMKGFRFANHYHTISYLGAFANHLLIHPNNPSVIYAATVADANLENSGFFRSIDGGNHWQELLNDVRIRWVRQVALHEKNPDIIYLSINSGEIYLSLDAGNTWERRGQLEFLESLIVDQENPELLYAGNPGFAADTLLYQSRDGGQNWRNVGSIAGLPSEMVQHSDQPEVLYHTTTDGLYRSEDSGRHWKRIKPSQRFNYQVILDAVNPNHIYLRSKGILRSLDAGQTWEQLLLSLSVHGFVLSQTNPRRAYASGYGWIRRLDLPPIESLGVDATDQWVTTLGYIKHSALLQNFPNPFNPETWIPYYLAEDARVTIQIYDVHGAWVRELDLGRKPAGAYVMPQITAYWDGRNIHGEDMTSGLYFYQLQAGDFTATRRMLLVK